MSYAKKRTNIAIKLIAVNIALIIIIEFFSKIILSNLFIPQYTYAPEYADFTTYQKIIGPFDPNQKVVLKFHIPYKVSINSLGLRGKNFSISKSQNTYRILCLGDSVTFGFGVSDGGDEQVFTDVLEAKLNSLNSTKKFEVINGGIGGTTITDQYAFLSKKGLKINPDLVILTFCRNDINDLAKKISVFEEIEQYISRKKGIFSIIGKTNTYRLMADVYRFGVVLFEALHRRLVAKKSYSPDKTNKSVKAMGANKQDTEIGKQGDGGIWSNYSWAKYAGYLFKMKTLLEENDIKLVMVVVLFDNPLLNNRVAQNAEIIHNLQKYTNEFNIPMVNYSTFFNDDIETEKLTFAPIDPHPSSYGHMIMGKYLGAFLIKNNIIVL